MVVPDHGGVLERICEGQADVEQGVPVQVQGEPDSRVSVGHAVHGVQDAADDEHLPHLVVAEAYVPNVLDGEVYHVQLENVNELETEAFCRRFERGLHATWSFTSHRS